MATDVFVRLKRGEKRPVFCAATVDSGTLLISGAPTCTLYDSTGAIVAGFNAIGVTGFDNTALAAVRCWLNLDAAGLAPSWYRLVFSFTAVGTDTISRGFVIEVAVLVSAVP